MATFVRSVTCVSAPSEEISALGKTDYLTGKLHTQYMKGSYRFTDHTADRQMVITGDPLEELYRQGVLGLRALLRGEQDFNESGRKVHRTINVESTDPTTLLVDFLSEVLTYAHIDKAVFTEVNFSQLDEKRLKAELSGYHVNGFDEEVKAVTYHEADVRKNKQGQWQSTIIFDI